MEEPMDILKEFPVRKSKAQKQAFRQAVIPYLQGLGYDCRVEEGSLGSRNLVIGNSRTADFLVTAHYDTCARLPFPNLAFPCDLLPTVLFQAGITAGLLLAAWAGAWVLAWILGWPGGITLLFGLLTLGELLLMLAGPANPSCVNDNTSGVITLLEIAKAMPESARGRVCLVLFDLEEAGLIGSASYYQAHRGDADRQIVLNLDCVGDGNHIALIPSRALRKDPAVLKDLSRCGGWFGKKRIFVKRSGFAFYPSDQMSFPRGVGICALRRRKKRLYLSRIHTKRDTVLEITNVNLLRSAIVSLIAVRQ